MVWQAKPFGSFERKAPLGLFRGIATKQEGQCDFGEPILIGRLINDYGDLGDAITAAEKLSTNPSEIIEIFNDGGNKIWGKEE